MLPPTPPPNEEDKNSEHIIVVYMLQYVGLLLARSGFIFAYFWFGMPVSTIMVRVQTGNIFIKLRSRIRSITVFASCVWYNKQDSSVILRSRALRVMYGLMQEDKAETAELKEWMCARVYTPYMGKTNLKLQDWRLGCVCLNLWPKWYAIERIEEIAQISAYFPLLFCCTTNGSTITGNHSKYNQILSVKIGIYRFSCAP